MTQDQNPAAVVADLDLPPLPEGDEFSATRMLQSGQLAPRYTAASMTAYARAAVAAFMARSAAPAPAVFWYEPSEVERMQLSDSAEMLTITGSNVKWGKWTTPLFAAQPAEGSAQVASVRYSQEFLTLLNKLSKQTAVGTYEAVLTDLINFIDKRAAPERSDTPAGLAEAIAYGYESGSYRRDPSDLAGEIILHYQSPAEAENAFEAITDAIDGVRQRGDKQGAQGDN